MKAGNRQEQANSREKTVVSWQTGVIHLAKASADKGWSGTENN